MRCVLRVQDPTLSAKAGLFIQYSAIGLPFTALFEFLRKPLLVQDITNPTMFISLAANILHIVLGYFFIRILALGYCGAAIARSVASVCLPLLLIPYCVWRRDVYRGWTLHWNWCFRYALRNHQHARLGYSFPWPQQSVSEIS